MKALLLFLSLFAASTAPAFAERMVFDDSQASFKAPEGFTRLNAEELAIKYPRKNPPRFAVGNEARTTTIAYDLKDIPFKDAELPEALSSIVQSMESGLPGMQWLEKKIIELQGQRWIYIEMTSRAVDTDIHNIMLMTSFEGKLLAINFNSTVGEFPQLEKKLRKSLGSIRLK